MRQVKLVEQNAPNHLDNHNTVRQMIHKGEFKDGTHMIMERTDSEKANMYSSTERPPLEQPFEDSLNIHTPSPNESLIVETVKDSSEENPTTIPEGKLNSPQAQSPAATEEEETFIIKLPDSEQTILIRCTKPVMIESLNNEVQMIAAQDDCYLVYYRDEEAYELQTQESLDEYLRLSDKPQLYVLKTEIFPPKIHHATDKSSEEEISIRIMGKIEQNLKLTCPKPAQLDALMNEITSLESLKDWKFDLMYITSDFEIKITTQEDLERYLAVSNRPPLLVKVKIVPCSIDEDIEHTYTNTSTTDIATDDVTLHFKLFDSEHILDMVCTKPLRLEAVLNDLTLIANLGDQNWQLVYSVDESSYVKIETQEDFDKYLFSTLTLPSTILIISNVF